MRLDYQLISVADNGMQHAIVYGHNVWLVNPLRCILRFGGG
jgi:hypothetical protein